MGDSDKWFWRSSPLFRFLILISEAKAQMRPSEIPHAAQEYDRVVLSFCCCCCRLDRQYPTMLAWNTYFILLPHILSARVTAALIPCPSSLPGFNFLNFIIIIITVHACTGQACVHFLCTWRRPGDNLRSQFFSSNLLWLLGWNSGHQAYAASGFNCQPHCCGVVSREDRSDVGLSL